MRGTLPRHPSSVACGNANLSTSSQHDSHCVFYCLNKRDRIYFDSYGQITPLEIQQYLKTRSEFYRCSEVIQRNTDIVQTAYTSVRGHHCLFVLKSLAGGEQSLWWIYIKILERYRLNQRSATFYQNIAMLGPIILNIYS